MGTPRLVVLLALACSPGALSAQARPDWTAVGPTKPTFFGQAVASAGDVNADGFADVIVGGPYFYGGEVEEGAAFLFLGSASGLAAASVWSHESDQTEAHFGHAVACAGDVNGDGHDDVLVGAPNDDTGTFDGGRAFLYLGTPGGVESTPAWTFEGTQGNVILGEQLGSAVSGAGDVNGDGYDDVVVSAPTYINGQKQEGRILVFHGSATGLAATPDWSVEGNRRFAKLGTSVACAGDVNGDGFADLVAGAPGYDGEGRAFLYLGSAAGLATTPIWTGSGASGSSFGFAVAAAGDVNGDGFGDVVVGAYKHTEHVTREGRAFVYLGSASGPELTASWTADGGQVDGFFAVSVASAGDVNADGYDELLIGAEHFANGDDDEGRALLYYGSALGLDPVARWVFEPDRQHALTGSSVASAGDVNGDGFGDVVVGSHHWDTVVASNPSEGRADAFHGGPKGLVPGALTTDRNAGANPASYVTSRPVIGQTWTATVDVSTTGHTHALVGVFALPGHRTLSGGQVLLGAGPLVARLAPHPGPLATWTFPVPNDVSLCGAAFATQAMHLFGLATPALSNAQDLLIGY